MSKTKQYSRRVTTPFGLLAVEDFSQTWEVSTLRDDAGHLVLQELPYSKSHYSNRYLKYGLDNTGRYIFPSAYGYLTPNGPNRAIIERNGRAANNRAYGKFVRSLRNDQGASLGVTLASFGQSLDMIGSKASAVSRMFDRGPVVKPGRKSTLKGRVADSYLEWIFGWTPLYGDMVDSLTTAITHDPSRDVCRVKGVGTARLTDTLRFDNEFSQFIVDNLSLKSRVTWAATARVTNPNLWLANKLGLVAAPSIAWDLVPWSFIVNGFGNFAQLIGSLTDFVGVELSQQSVTTTHNWFGRADAKSKNDPRVTGWSTYNNTVKVRSVGQPLVPSLQLKLPSTSLGYCAMVTSLIVQKADRLTRVVPPIHRRYLTTTGKKIPREYWHL